MTRGLAFWILILLWLVLGIFWHVGLWAPAAWGVALIPFLALVLVGWQVFGPPLR